MPDPIETADERPAGRAARRALALTIGLSLCAVIFLALRALGVFDPGFIEPGEKNLSGVVDNRTALFDLLRERAKRGAIEPVAGVLVREPISREEAFNLFGILRPKRAAARYSPEAYFELKPGIDRYIPFRHHPDKGFRVHTNGAGLREDEDILVEQPDLRVIVAGDSQTEGACNNTESYPNRLEALLSERHPGRTIEVLNTGRSGYSFYNYLGVLEKYLAYAPNAFVMTVHGGNDFIDNLSYWHYFHRTVPVDCQECLARRNLMNPKQEPNNVYLQALYQVHYLAHHPDEMERAIAAAIDVTNEAKRICDENDVRFVCVYLPTVIDTQRDRYGRFIETECEMLELSEEDLEINARLGERWLEHARSLGIPCVDLRPAIREQAKPCYWPFDLHLNLVGNSVAAEAVLPLVDDLVP